MSHGTFSHELLQCLATDRVRGAVCDLAAERCGEEVLQHRGVEARRREAEHNRLLDLREAGRFRCGVVGQTGVRDAHTLRSSGRS
ncbi:Uncharacterised protein [Mycobacteroides abscessus subsp. abscessus]|nr:Uncharacterised protein [Mycobacteroides abscessus subsp. abscessus]